MSDNNKQGDFDKELSDFLDFVNAASDACRNSSEAEFDCPVCGGKANAWRPGRNGHVHAKCRNCDMSMMQ